MKIARYLSLLGLFLIPSFASAIIYSNVELGDLKYDLEEIGDVRTATVKALSSTVTEVEDLVIPASVTYPEDDGKTFKVTTIKTLTGASTKAKGSLTISEGIETINNNVFRGCSAFTGTLTIPGSVKSIGNYAFQNCTGFTGLVLGEGVETIGQAAFDGCTGFKGTLTLPESLTALQKQAFRKCSGFDGELVIPGNLEAISDNAFEGCSGLTSVVISDGVKTIGTSSFLSCSGLTGVTFGNTLETIGNQAFSGLSKLSGDLEIPNSVTSIGTSAFYNCSGLTGTLTIGTGLTTLGTGAFSNCGFTGDLKLPDGLTAIPASVFYNCKFNGTLTLPGDLKTIGVNAFGKTAFTGSLELPESLQEIGEGAFLSNKGFTGDLVIPNNVTSIGKNAFNGMTGIDGTLTIGENVATIADNAFYSSGAKTLYLLAQSNTSYAADAFAATKFTDIYMSAVVPLTIAETTFSADDYAEATLHVPGRGAEAYAASETWKQFQNINALAIDVTDIIINQGNTTIKLGADFDLTATIDPADATNKKVNWSVEPAGILTLTPAAADETLEEGVDSKVTVKGAALGKATVTAKSDADETILATVEITVDPILPEKVTIEPADLAVLLGAKDKLTATVYPEETTNPAYTWASSDDKVVTIDEDGNYEAVGEGEATITLTCAEKDEDGNEVTATVSVKVAPVPATGVAVTPTEATLIIGEETDLTATVEPEHTTHPTVTWTSSDEKIATVDENGHVVAVADGEVTITATWTDTSDATNTLTGESKITVKPVVAESVVVTPSEATLYIGRTETLTAKVEPENVTYPELTWTSGDETVATLEVNEDGSVTVKGLKEGNVTISATWTDSDDETVTVVGNCEINVVPVMADKIELDREDVVLIFGEEGKDTFKFTPVITPEDTTDKTVTWTSGDDSVVAVAEDGTISAVAVGGPVTITATCGEATATCQVTVEPVLATSVTLNATELTLLVEETSKLEATVAPANTTDKTVVYESDNTDVATVAEDGTVTAVSVGTANITASCGDVSATCAVTVNPILATAVVLSETSKEIFVEETLTLTATVEPANTTDKTLVWTSSDEAVATVKDGVVTAVAPAP